MVFVRHIGKFSTSLKPCDFLSVVLKDKTFILSDTSVHNDSETLHPGTILRHGCLGEPYQHRRHLESHKSNAAGPVKTICLTADRQTAVGSEDRD